MLGHRRIIRETAIHDPGQSNISLNCLPEVFRRQRQRIAVAHDTVAAVSADTDMQLRYSGGGRRKIFTGRDPVLVCLPHSQMQHLRQLLLQGQLHSQD